MSSELSIGWRQGLLTDGSIPVPDIVAICPSGKVSGRKESEILLYTDRKGDGALSLEEDAFPASVGLSEIEKTFRLARRGLVPMMDKNRREYLVNEEYQDSVSGVLKPAA